MLPTRLAGGPRHPVSPPFLCPSVAMARSHLITSELHVRHLPLCPPGPRGPGGKDDPVSRTSS